MNIIGTGLSGLVGSRVVELLTTHTFTNLSLEHGIDITDTASVSSYIHSATDAMWVLHLAAYTNVQQAEKERALGENSVAWRVNVDATQNIVDVCKATGKRLLYIDTDYAFDGTKDTYTEDDIPHPLSWYAYTKSEGAKRVLTLKEGSAIVRISNPYRSMVGLSNGKQGKKDFVHKMLECLSANQEIVAPSDQIFVPTFVDDIAYALETLMMQEASGIFHVVGSQALSPFDAARSLARLYGFDESLVRSTSFESYFKGRAPTPKKAVLCIDKVRALGIKMKGFEDGIAEMKHQEDEMKLYR